MTASALAKVEVALIEAAQQTGKAGSDPTAILQTVAKHTHGLKRGDLLALVRRQAATNANLLRVIDRAAPGSSATILEQISDPVAAAALKILEGS